MDDSVIQEIANQLGMAVDQAGQFIQEQLPNFAALQAVKSVHLTKCLSCGFFAAGVTQDESEKIFLKGGIDRKNDGRDTHIKA